jgi:RNA 2',3'-cyclic 3'-phosphodiesterase
MHRLFVAVDLDENAREAVSRICSGIPGVKWVDAIQLHLTLRFIGDANDSLCERIREELAGVTAAPFTLALRGVGRFPPKRDPRVLWVGIEQSEGLFSLHRLIEEAMERIGLEPELREFSPHITLARLKDMPLSKIAPFLERNRLFATPPVPMAEFHLYSSTLSTRGAIHNRLASYPLWG